MTLLCPICGCSDDQGCLPNCKDGRWLVSGKKQFDVNSLNARVQELERLMFCIKHDMREITLIQHNYLDLKDSNDEIVEKIIEIEDKYKERFDPPLKPVMNELKRLDSTINSIAHQIKFALEAMSEALERMEVRIYNVENKK